MRKSNFILTSFVFSVLLLLSACGQKGDLYMPGEKQTHNTVETNEMIS